MRAMRWFVVGLIVGAVGCGETTANEEQTRETSWLDQCQSNAPSFIQGTDESATIPPTDVLLVPRVTAERTWTIAELPCPLRMQLVARDVPGAAVILRRENSTTMGAFDGTGTGWITLHRHDEGNGVTWHVVGWSGAVTIPGDP